MKNMLGLVLLTVGIGLTAGFGAVLSPDFRAATAKAGEASFADKGVDEAVETYCSLRDKFKAGSADGCGDAAPLVPDSDGLSKTQLRTAQLQALNAAEREVLVLEVSQARIQYRLAVKKSLKRWTQLEAMGTQGPVPRLSGWFSTAGIGFLVGLVLLVSGAWMSRRGAAVQVASDAEGPEAEDFGVMLERVSGSVRGLHEEMAACAAPTVTDLEQFKGQLEDIQKGDLARLCAAGPRATARHGVEGMAQLFSPLSGAERKLNRAWAAMVDQHWPEALGSVAGAVAQLNDTKTALDDL